MTKHYDQKRFIEELILMYNSRGKRFHRSEGMWQEMAGMKTGAGS